MKSFMLKSILEQINIDIEKAELISDFAGGSTNETCIIKYNDSKYVVRYGSSQSGQMCIDRRAEKLTLQILAENTAKVYYFDIVSGNMVTEYIEGYLISAEDLREKNYLRKLFKVLKKVHSKKIDYEFDPHYQIEKRFEYCRKNNIYLPDNLSLILEKDITINNRLLKDKYKYFGLCHNDLFTGNIILNRNDEIILIDCEYAGNGDIFFDLACLAWNCNLNQKQQLIELYFGYCDDILLKRLNDSLFVVKLWNASWAAVKSETQDENTFDYKSGYINILNNLAELSI